MGKRKALKMPWQLTRDQAAAIAAALSYLEKTPFPEGAKTRIRYVVRKLREVLLLGGWHLDEVTWKLSLAGAQEKDYKVFIGVSKKATPKELETLERILLKHKIIYQPPLWSIMRPPVEHKHYRWLAAVDRLILPKGELMLLLEDLQKALPRKVKVSLYTPVPPAEGTGECLLYEVRPGEALCALRKGDLY